MTTGHAILFAGTLIAAALVLAAFILINEGDDE